MTNFQPRGVSRRPMREVRDMRKPLYMLFVLDTSSSMYENVSIGDKEGEIRQAKKIDDLNRGLETALNSLRKFEANNVLYKIYYQIIELNSYGKALFPDFVPLSVQSEEICFEAAGVTCLENSIATLKSFLHPKHMPGCNRAVNIILFSDGYPTDIEGYVVDEDVYEKSISDFKGYLSERGLKANVDLYSIGIGEDACESMLVKFADAGKYYKVDILESLAEKLDFVTRKSLVRHSTRPMRAPDAREREEESAITESVDVREIDVLKCLKDSCLACIDACALSAIRYEAGLVTISPDLCIGCGACSFRCPNDAIHIQDDSGCDDLL